MLTWDSVPGWDTDLSLSAGWDADPGLSAFVGR